MHIANILTTKVLVIGNMYRYLGERLFVHPKALSGAVFRSSKVVVRHLKPTTTGFSILALLLLIYNEIHHILCLRFSKFHVAPFEGDKTEVF